MLEVVVEVEMEEEIIEEYIGVEMVIQITKETPNQMRKMVIAAARVVMEEVEVLTMEEEEDMVAEEKVHTSPP